MTDSTTLLDYVRRRTVALQTHARDNTAFGTDTLKAARNWAYTRGNSLGYQDAGSKLLEVDTGKMSARFKITSNTRDRMGDVVKANGCTKTIANYLRNPRVFFGHESHDFPIGSARTPDGVSTLEYAEDGITATVFFNGLTEISNQVFAFVAARELEATSIGFLPLKGTLIARPPKSKDTDELQFDYGGVVFEEWDLLEFSVVPVPANPDAVSMWLSKGVDGKPLAPALKSYLEPFAPPRSVWVPGIEMATLPDVTPLASLPLENKDVPITPTDITPPSPASQPPEVVVLPASTVIEPLVKDAPLPEPAVIKEPLPESLPPTALASPTPPASDTPDCPYGLKAMRCAMAHCDSVMCAVDSMCKNLEHPKVKKHMKKFSKYMSEHKDDLLEAAKEHYPEHHGLPPDDVDEDDKKDATPTVVKESDYDLIAPVVEIDMKQVLAAIQELNKAKAAMDDRLYAIDGRR